MSTMMKYTCTSELNEEQMKSISSWIKWKHNEMTGEETEDLFVEYVTVMITNSKSMEEISKDLLDLEMFEENDAKVFALALGEQLMKLEGSSSIVDKNTSNIKKEKKEITNDNKKVEKIKDKRVNDLLDKPLGTSRDGKTMIGNEKGKRSIIDRLGDIDDVGVGRKRGLDKHYDQSNNKRERGHGGPMHMNPMAMMMDPNLMKEQMNMMAQMSGFSSLEDMMKFNQELMKKMHSGELGMSGNPGRGFGGRMSERGRGRFAERGGRGRFAGRGRGDPSILPSHPPKTEEELDIAPAKHSKSATTTDNADTTPKENIEEDETNMTNNDFEFNGDGTFEGRGGRGGRSGRGRGRFSTRGRGRFPDFAGRGRSGRGPIASKNKVWVREPTIDTALPGTITSTLMK